jgi:hypothetical protein
MSAFTLPLRSLDWCWSDKLTIITVAEGTMDPSISSPAVTPRPDGNGWVGRDLTDASEWSVELDDDTVTRLVDHARLTAAANRPAYRIDHPPIVVALDAIRTELVNGRGFSLVRGFPVEDLSEIENETLCTTLGLHLGIPIRQNASGEQSVRVRDTGKNFDDEGVRSYETAAPLPYHSDSSDVVGLYCVRSARSGGESTIVSSAAIHDVILERRPDLATLLHETWATASPVSRTVQHTPICAADPSGAIHTRYGRRYVEPSADADVQIPPLAPDRTEALDLYDSLLHDPDFALDMEFQPGDVQFLNNYRVMHGRAPYTDWPDPAKRRELLRVWLVVEQMDIPDVFEDSGFVPRGEALGSDQRRR